MVVVTTTGYIIAIFGPFFSDNSNNDASILKHIMINNYDDILNWVEENDIMILDRGFRDSLGVLKSLGIDVAMPSFLGPKQKQFDVQQANNSRFVTMLRWVVESCNARIKRFKWFSQVIPNSSLSSIEDFMAILAALLNCFHTPMVTPSPHDDHIIARMNSLRTKSNALQTHLIDNQLTRNSIWKVTDIHHLPQAFPMLSLGDIRSLTLGISLLLISHLHFSILGVYQLKRARSYAEEHAGSTDLTDPNVEFPIQQCTDTNARDIIRIRFQSAHKRSCQYYTYIKFDLNQVLAWYCTCPGGPRVVGCCSHVASAIWFLAYERHQLNTNPQPSSTNSATLHYCNSISDYEYSSDENDEITYYSLRSH
jgi:hypothetical protein